VDWIGLRPERLAPLVPVDGARVTEAGLEGDHGRPGKRAVTLFQSEHLDVVARFLGRDAVSPEDLRRNIHISGLNLNPFRGHALRIGTTVIELTVPCAPCSRMESILGPGGYNALRGHGGWCARVLEPGIVHRADPILRLSR